MVAPIAKEIIEELSPNDSTKSAKVLLVSIWEIGEAAGPLLIAPLSEYFGRRPVMTICSVVAVAATVISCIAPTANILIFGRLLSGAVVTSNVLNPAIIGDILAPEERGTAMSVMLLAPLVGGTFGPAFAGFAAERWHWRYAMLTCVVFSVIASVTLFLTFKETYGPAILKKAAAKSTAKTQAVVTEAEALENQTSDKAKLWEAIFRPARVLRSSGILLVLSLHTAVAFSYIYVVAVAVPEIVEGIYGLTPTHTGFIFIANGNTLFKIVLSLKYTNIQQDSAHYLASLLPRRPSILSTFASRLPTMALESQNFAFPWPLSAALFLVLASCSLAGARLFIGRYGSVYLP